MRINSFFTKLLIIFSILLLTYLYAQYEKNKYYSDNNASSSSELVLKFLPEFNSNELNSGKLVNSVKFLQGSSGIFVHIWGTWCAPCEKEMPDFLKYAESVKSKGVKFLLVAVNDEEFKVKKFMGRFVIPENVTVVVNKENIAMDLFGTLKVPETFLFNANGAHANKFVGPQDWLLDSYKTNLDLWLSTHNSVSHKVETH